MLSINPCKACLDAYGYDANINTLNDCVVETASAYAGIPNNSVLSTGDMHTNWEECMSRTIEGCGRNKCDLRLSMAPVFNNGAHFFPELMVKLKDKKKALQQCVMMCSTQSNKPETCKQNCTIDSMALEEYVNPKNVQIEMPRKINKSSWAYAIMIIAITLFMVVMYWK